jgi:hypothetical protein
VQRWDPPTSPLGMKRFARILACLFIGLAGTPSASFAHRRSHLHPLRLRIVHVLAALATVLFCDPARAQTQSLPGLTFTNVFRFGTSFSSGIGGALVGVEPPGRGPPALYGGFSEFDLTALTTDGVANLSFVLRSVSASFEFAVEPYTGPLSGLVGVGAYKANNSADTSDMCIPLDCTFEPYAGGGPNFPARPNLTFGGFGAVDPNLPLGTVITFDATSALAFARANDLPSLGVYLFAPTLSGGGGRTVLGFDSFVLTVTAVPEPETYAMLLAGLALVGAAARRKRAFPSCRAHCG